MSTCAILVVDDNEASAFVIARLLEKLGHSTVVAHDANEALALVRARRPQLVISDLSMPGMDGCGFAQQLRMESPTNGLRLIAVTGYSEPQVQEQALAAGFNEVIVKPLSITELQRVLARYLTDGDSSVIS